jgi:hypothetical protein
MNNLDPISILMILLFQFGNRFAKISLTKAQEKLLVHPVIQFVMFFCIMYFTTKSVLMSFIIIGLAYVFLNILFNENNKYNILSEKWLISENLIVNLPNTRIKESYKYNVQKFNE